MGGFCVRFVCIKEACLFVGMERGGGEERVGYCAM